MIWSARNADFVANGFQPGLTINPSGNMTVVPVD